MSRIFVDTEPVFPPYLKERFILSGEIFVATTPHRIKTVLGSCVSICLWDSKSGIGGMSHFLAPRWNGKGMASNSYGDVSTRNLLSRMLYLGAQKENIVAKVVGGGSQMGMISPKWTAGRSNVELAREFLQKEGITVVSTCTGGRHGRNIVFDTSTGNVHIRKIIPSRGSGARAASGKAVPMPAGPPAFVTNENI